MPGELHLVHLGLKLSLVRLGLKLSLVHLGLGDHSLVV